jgi:acetyl esterase
MYRPSQAEDLPVLVYMHGGGWFAGDLDMVDANCRELSARVGCLVVSVDYCLAPGHRFPLALEEVHAVSGWLSEQSAALGIDRRRLAIGGESAGGNLAAAECLLARDRGGPDYVLQLLLYPVLDPDLQRDELDSVRDPILSTGLIRLMWRRYLGQDADRRNPLAAPIVAQSLLALPPALILTGGTDPLRFEGAEYAARLDRAGTPATHRHYDGLFHGFFGLPHPRAEAAMDDAVAALKQAFAVGAGAAAGGGARQAWAKRL